MKRSDNVVPSIEFTASQTLLFYFSPVFEGGTPQRHQKTFLKTLTSIPALATSNLVVFAPTTAIFNIFISIFNIFLRFVHSKLKNSGLINGIIVILAFMAKIHVIRFHFKVGKNQQMEKWEFGRQLWKYWYFWQLNFNILQLYGHSMKGGLKLKTTYFNTFFAIFWCFTRFWLF